MILQVKHQSLKTNLQGLLSHLQILIFSKSNLKLQVFGLSSRFVRTLIINISSSERPANTTSIHRARNSGRLVVLFHPSPKNITKRGPILRKRTENIKMARNAPNKIILAHALQNAPLLRGRGQCHSPWYKFLTLPSHSLPLKSKVAAIIFVRKY